MGNDHILAIGRYYNGKKLLALFNFSTNEEAIFIDEGEDYCELLTGECYKDESVTIPSYGFL